MRRERVGEGAALVRVADDKGKAVEGAAAEGAAVDGAEEAVGADDKVWADEVEGCDEGASVVAAVAAAWEGAQLKRFSMMLLIVS